jgi:hypothetical protein
MARQNIMVVGACGGGYLPYGRQEAGEEQRGAWDKIQPKGHTSWRPTFQYMSSLRGTLHIQTVTESLNFEYI